MAASANLRDYAVRIRAIPFDQMIVAAKAAKKVALEEGRRVGGSDGLKGKKRRGLKLRARDDISEHGSTTICRIQGVSPAGWVWVETGTGPHNIRRRKRGPMRRMTVPHPGTSGRHLWTRGVYPRVARIVPLIFTDAVHEALNR